MPLQTTDIDFLRSLISQRSGNVLSANQSYLLESRLAPVAASAGLDSVQALVSELRRGTTGSLPDRVAEAMTINETSFFRDIHPFDALEKAVLPELMKRRASSRKLSIWCAASSSGQEPYSILITLRERFAELLNWDVRLLATDLSDEMLARTRDGRYSQFEVNRGLPAKLLVKYFDRLGLDWQVKPELRRQITCRKLNLTSNWPAPTQFDIVFLRNVLIYFDKNTKEAILRRVHRTMAPDGSLFLGGGETLINLDAPFQRVQVASTVCFRPADNDLRRPMT